MSQSALEVAVLIVVRHKGHQFAPPLHVHLNDLVCFLRLRYQLFLQVCVVADVPRLLYLHLGYLVFFLGDSCGPVLDLAPVFEVGHDRDHDLSVPRSPVVKCSPVDLLTVLVRPGMLLP